MRQSAVALHPFILVSILLATGSVAMNAQADWITEPELRESCDAFVTLPYSLEGSTCLAFVQGFLLGANRIAVVENGSGETKSPAGKETFVERAVRTRLGDSHIQRINAASEIKYCIDENTAVAELVQAISDYLNNSPSSTTGAAGLTKPQTLQQALADRFPCDH
jgi:hypothetical protein